MAGFPQDGGYKPVKPLSLWKFFERFPDEDVAVRFIERVRWPKGPGCPHGGSVRVGPGTPMAASVP